MLLDDYDVSRATERVVQSVVGERETFLVDVNDLNSEFLAQVVEPPENSSSRMNRVFSILFVQPVMTLAICRGKPLGSVFDNTNVASWEQLGIARKFDPDLVHRAKMDEERLRGQDWESMMSFFDPLLRRKDAVSLAKVLLTLTDPCSNPEFPQEQLKDYHSIKIFVFLRGPTIWRVMSRNESNDVLSWRSGRLSNSTKYPLHASMTIISKKKKQNLLENCQIHALKLFWNAWTWHGLEDLIYSMVIERSLNGRSKNGPKLVTNDYFVWSLTYIIHVNANSMAMWETLRNNAHWDCFKTPILQEILRIQNRHQVVRCPFLDDIRLFHSLGCARNKLQFRTVQQNQKSFLRMQDWLWTVSPHLMYGIWSSQYLETRIRVIKNGETCVRTYV